MCRVHHPNGSLPRLKYGNNVVEVYVGLVGTISDFVTLFDLLLSDISESRGGSVTIHFVK